MPSVAVTVPILNLLDYLGLAVLARVEVVAGADFQGVIRPEPRHDLVAQVAFGRSKGEL